MGEQESTKDREVCINCCNQSQIVMQPVVKQLTTKDREACINNCNQSQILMQPVVKQLTTKNRGLHPLLKLITNLYATADDQGQSDLERP